jgi:hypothetical protein
MSWLPGLYEPMHVRSKVAWTRCSVAKCLGTRTICLARHYLPRHQANTPYCMPTCSHLGLKTIRIFSDRIRDRIHLERFRSVRIQVRIFKHPIPYPYPNNQITYLWRRYPIISYSTWLTISVFKSKSGQKYKNKYNISDIRSYPICFHPYSHRIGGKKPIPLGGLYQPSMHGACMVRCI